MDNTKGIDGDIFVNNYSRISLFEMLFLLYYTYNISSCNLIQTTFHIDGVESQNILIVKWDTPYIFVVEGLS